ncbi:MAG TPA: hypothetical protein VF815_35990 [Myxococcaceae bacterium]|jgi:hypothetical protein
MTNPPPRPVSLPSPRELPLLEDPEHPGRFVVRRIGTLTLLLVGGLCAAMLLAGSQVRLEVPVPGEGAPRVESVSLGHYVLRQLGLWPLPGRAEPAP